MIVTRKIREFLSRSKSIFDYYLKKPDKEVMAYVHIPKTAGTTLNSIINSNYHPARVFNLTVAGRMDIDGKGKTLFSRDQDTQEIRERIKAHQKQINCISGHLPYGVHKLIDRPTHYITILREPLSRALSQWRHAIRAGEQSALGRLLLEYDFNLQKALEDNAVLQFMNDQTRMITGSDRVHLDERDYDEALNVLQSDYALVGLSETFSVFLTEASSKFNWSNTLYSKLNTAPRDSENIRFTKNEEALIRQYNKIDFDLYSWIKEQQVKK